MYFIDYSADEQHMKDGFGWTCGKRGLRLQVEKRTLCDHPKRKQIT